MIHIVSFFRTVKSDGLHRFFFLRKLTSMNRGQTISRVTVWGAIANTFLAVVKLFAGIAGRSSAMMADAIHSFSDLVSDIIILFMVKVSSKEKDHDHEYGHGKYETLATITVALLLIVVGAKLMVEGVEKIRLVIQGGSIETPGGIALWTALLSVLTKEILYQWTARTGRRVNSPAMITNAWHHRTDALSSIGAAAGIGAAMLFGGRWAVLDPLVCCAISIFIFYIAVQMGLPALDELTERALPKEMEDKICSIIRSVDGINDVHALKTRKNGPAIIIESHIVVNPKMSVADAHKLTVLAESALREYFGEETQISLHVEPSIEAE